ncbi:MAG: hypothetical protein K8F30_15375 [Taibaiella sp.]|nr:hypothetical protein [Taibaiella sp.]
MKNTLLILLMTVLAITACNTNNVRGDLKNRREILQSSYWKLESATANGGGTSFPKCQDDNYYNFEPGGTGRYEEGPDNCLDSTGTGNAPTYTPYIWQMTGDLRYIYIMNYGGDPEKRIEWQILEMDFKEMLVRQMVVVDGIDVRLDMTYRAMTK